ncbi:ABC transporter permease [Nocardioides sp. Kera G14]|uniref:ABC transporter permease n=1 Tax=Nocardioides sp. Kera G14 TaxID=2884264 RepID=UPI001D10C79C|nr:ABC transporter permease subunit [Nocardioides sp. Kera G14]UDY25094.1 ABC transporter permease subunit [Nocardioides sp. Kera G14]
MRSLSLRTPWVGGLTGIVVIVVAWWLASIPYVTPSGNPGAIPSPWLVAKEFLGAFGDSVYWRAVGHSSGEALRGYLWGDVIAFAMALLVLVVPRLDSFVMQLAVVTSCIPITAVGPIVALMGQAGSRAAAVFLAALLCIFPTVVGCLLGLRSASSTQLDVITAYGGGRITQLRKVQLIAAVPNIIAALKVGAPMAVLGAVLGEYFLSGVDSGIGVLLVSSQATGNSVRVWAIALICAAIAGVAYGLIALLGRLLTPWAAGDDRVGAL